MSNSELPNSELNGVEQTRRQPRRLPWLRYGFYVLVAAIVVVLLAFGRLEALAWKHRATSISNLKAYAKKLERGTHFPAEEVERQLVGWTVRKEVPYRESKLLVYAWPSVLSDCCLRVWVGRVGYIVCMDTEVDEQKDFVQPFLADGQDGVWVHDPAGGPPQYAEQVKIDFIGRIREAFSAPREPLVAGVVIFPVTDAQQVITPTGAALSMIAQNSVVSTPKQQMALDPRLVRQTLMATGTWRGGTKLDQRHLDLCLAAIGTPLHVRPRIEMRDGKQLLLMELYGTSAKKRPEFSRDITGLELSVIPGLIALDLLDHLKVQLSHEERGWVATPQFKTERDVEEFVVESEKMSRDFAAKWNLQNRLLQRNPNWVAAWEMVLDVPHQSYSSGVLPPTDKKLSEFGVIARHFNNATGPENQFLALLKLAPSQRGQALYHGQLVRMARRLLGEAVVMEVVTELMDIWEREDNSYASRVERGWNWMDWAWQIRGAGFEPGVSPKDRQEFQRRMAMAQHEFNQAIAANPKGWEAHAEMIRVARGLGLDYAVQQQHFKQSVDILPHNLLAYHAKQEYLEKKWYGTNETLYEFADECLADGDWDSGIPQLVPSILAQIEINPETNSIDSKVAQSPEYWARVNAYWQIAQKQKQTKGDLNFYARNAVLAGHYAEAAPLFDLMDEETVRPLEAVEIENYPPSVETTYQQLTFGSDARYHELRDRVHAQTRDGMQKILPAIRVALADARLTDAEQLLTSAKPETADDRAETYRLRRALQFGQRLQTERRISLSPQEALNLFAEVKRLSCRGIDQNPWWQAEGDQLIYTSPGYTRALGWVKECKIFFPVGMCEGKISAVLDMEGQGGMLEVIVRSQSLSQSTTLGYVLDDRSIRLMRNYQQLITAKLPDRPYPFAIEMQADVDRVSPIPGLDWQATVTADVPSSFGLGMTRGGKDPIKFSIRNLTIELIR